MHLAYVTTALPFSLEETYVIAEIVEIQRRGHRVTIIPTRPGRAVIHNDGRPLVEFTIAESLLSTSILSYAFMEILRAPTLALRSALLLVTSRSMRVFLKNLAVFPKGLWLARVAKREGVDHIHAHFASTNATLALVASIVSNIPWSFTAHRWDIAENNLLDKKADAAKFARAIDARGGRDLRSYVTAPQHKLRLIHMGVPFHSPDPKREETPREVLRVLLGARFDEGKGHRYALDAIARLKGSDVNVSLCCAGDGPLRSKMENYARALGILDRVQFPGLLDHEHLLSQLRDHQWDVALLPSIETSEDWEGIPVFLIEAMAAGIPVVATNTGGIPELLGGGAGVLIPQRNALSIAAALETLAADANLRGQLAKIGIRRIRDEFTVQSTVSTLLGEISSETPPEPLVTFERNRGQRLH